MEDNLNDYFSKLGEMERKSADIKKYLDCLRTQIKERKEKLSSLDCHKKGIEMKTQSVYSKIPEIQTQVMVTESENKILVKQIESFEQKIADLNKKMSEMNENHKQMIDSFVEKGYNYCRDYGPNGRIRSQTDIYRNRVQSLRNKRNELIDKNHSLEQKDFESILLNRNALNEKFLNLTKKQTSLQRESSEWKTIISNHKTKLKELKEDESTELNDLRKELQTMEEMERTEIESHLLKVPDIAIKSEPIVVEVDSDVSDCMEERYVSRPQPSVSVQQSREGSQSICEMPRSKRVCVKREETDDKKLWEMRQKRFRNSNN